MYMKVHFELMKCNHQLYELLKTLNIYSNDTLIHHRFTTSDVLKDEFW